MKKKGFTLVELLGVIIILAVIALIAVPTILGVIDKAKRSSLQDSGYGLVETANLYYAQYSNSKTVRFDIENNKIITEEENKLNYKGTIKNGTVLINNKGEVTVCINDGKHAAYKNYKDSKVTIVDKKTCTVPESSYIVYLDDEATITEMTNQELTEAVADLIEKVNNLEKENTKLKEQLAKKENTTDHNTEVSEVWNKVGTEDLSGISDGSISQIIINNNSLINTIQTNLNNNTSSISSISSRVDTLTSSLNSKADSSHTHTWSSITGKPDSYSSAPRGQVVDYSVLSSGSTYTAPSDGYFSVKHIGGYTAIVSSWTGFINGNDCANSGGNYCYVLLPVSKNESVDLWYNDSIDYIHFFSQN